MPSVCETLRSMADFLESHKGALEDAQDMLRIIKAKIGQRPNLEVISDIDAYFGRHAKVAPVQAAQPAQPAPEPEERQIMAAPSVSRPMMGR